MLGVLNLQKLHCSMQKIDIPFNGFGRIANGGGVCRNYTHTKEQSVARVPTMNTVSNRVRNYIPLFKESVTVASRDVVNNCVWEKSHTWPNLWEHSFKPFENFWKAGELPCWLNFSPHLKRVKVGVRAMDQYSSHW